MGGAAQRVDSGRPRKAAFGRGRPGPIRRELRKALADAREHGRLTAELEVRALVADRLAEVVDRSASDGDGPGLMRAADKLLEVLETIPIRAPGGGDPVGSDGGRSNVVQLLDSPPQVGDAADA